MSNMLIVQKRDNRKAVRVEKNSIEQIFKLTFTNLHKLHSTISSLAGEDLQEPCFDDLIVRRTKLGCLQCMGDEVKLK